MTRKWKNLNYYATTSPSFVFIIIFTNCFDGILAPIVVKQKLYILKFNFNFFIILRTVCFNETDPILERATIQNGASYCQFVNIMLENNSTILYVEDLARSLIERNFTVPVQSR